MKAPREIKRATSEARRDVGKKNGVVKWFGDYMMWYLLKLETSKKKYKRKKDLPDSE